MVVVINAVNNEFASASGSNVNATPDYSYFDHPPDATTDLVITSNPGDPSPREFGIGDTYYLSWSDAGTARSIEDATVIRSDYVGPGQGAVVFEGTDSATGDPVQIVWSPGHDLENWYWTNGGGPSTPNGFWTSDQNNAATYQTVCFAEGTLIDTPMGPRAVEDLAPDDPVSTLDHGAQPVLWTRQRTESLDEATEGARPVLISAGALGPDRPRADLVVSPQHRILVGGRQQLKRGFTREALIPAKSLTMLPGIRQMRGRKSITWVHFACRRHEIVTANGCLSETLLLGPMVTQALTPHERHILQHTFPGPFAEGMPWNGPAARTCLSVKEARAALRLSQRSNKAKKAGETVSQPMTRNATMAFHSGSQGARP